jgi:hypothetical protein
MRKVYLVLILAALLGCVAIDAWAEKSPLGKECLVPGLYVWEDELMEALFGNYYPGLKVSALDPRLTADPELIKWTIVDPIDAMLGDWDEIQPETQEEFMALQGKIPLRFLGIYRFPNNRMLVVFEAGQWMFDSKYWGGANFTGSHNLGMAAFTLVTEGWKLTGYDLNLGRFGAYCTTTLGQDAIKLGDNEYGIMTLDYGRAIFTIDDGDPIVLLRIPHYHGYGHGDPEGWDSVISFEASGKQFYDVVVASTGDNYETGERLSFHRRWVWDAPSEQYLLAGFEGNIRNVQDDPDYWLLDEDY